MSARLPADGVVLGVHHVQLSYPAHLQAQVERFYSEGLGLPRIMHAQVLAYLAGAQRIDLVPRTTPGHGCECLGHLALQVAGVEALQQRLQAQGATALAVVRVAEGWRFYAKDPAGNTLELLQPAPLAAPRPRPPVATQGAVGQPAMADSAWAVAA